MPSGDRWTWTPDRVTPAWQDVSADVLVTDRAGEAELQQYVWTRPPLSNIHTPVLPARKINSLPLQPSSFFSTSASLETPDQVSDWCNPSTIFETRAATAGVTHGVLQGSVLGLVIFYMTFSSFLHQPSFVGCMTVYGTKESVFTMIIIVLQIHKNLVYHRIISSYDAALSLIWSHALVC